MMSAAWRQLSCACWHTSCELQKLGQTIPSRDEPNEGWLSTLVVCLAAGLPCHAAGYRLLRPAMPCCCTGPFCPN